MGETGQRTGFASSPAMSGYVFAFLVVPRAQIRIACVGNSITQGDGLVNPGT